MSRPAYEIADVMARIGKQFLEQCKPNIFQQNVLHAIAACRTAELGYHVQACNNCGEIRVSYNSCRNRHCPKCQGSRQAIWIEGLLEMALPVKHYHIVFTVPHELNSLCMLDSRWFYGQLFASVWDTIRMFGYSHYGVESGAVCVLHTWGQNLSFHPHIHCIVPAAGETLAANLKHIAANGKFIYPVRQLSCTFRGKLMQSIKNHLKQNALLKQYQSLIETAYLKPWTVFAQPSFGKPEHVVKYLGQYTHRVAISNHRLLRIDNESVTFMYKDYAHNAIQKPVTLSGIEFLRRFCLHILPLRFVKIRYYGIYSSRYRALKKASSAKMALKQKSETVPERILRLTGFDVLKCPLCKEGRLVTIEIVPRVRSPARLKHLLH